jgi:hypothetical protein
MSNFSADFQSASQPAALIGPVQTTSSTGGYDFICKEILLNHNIPCYRIWRWLL